MTAHRKRTAGPERRRTPADDDPRDLYVGGRPPSFWEAHRASLLVLVVLAVSLVAWLLWGGRSG